MTKPLPPPRGINVFNAIAKPLLAAGFPMAFNGLITIPGRKTGKPRTTALAIVDVDGRRWVWSPWGEVHWVRNLRAAGGATITFRRREEEVRAVELDPEQRVAFFRDTLTPIARRIRGGMWFIRAFDRAGLRGTAAAGKDRPGVELCPAS